MHFSNHPGFQDFITKRNEAWSKLGTMSDQEDQDDEAKDKSRKKRRVTKQDPSSEVVEVPLNGTSIQCLMQGQKPTLSDVVIPLAKEQLEPFFVLLQSNQESLESRKPYKMAAKQS